MIKKTAWFFGTLQCFQTRSDLKLCEAMNLPRYRWFLRDSTFLCRVRKIWVIRFGWTLIPWCVHPIGNKHTSQVCCWRPMVKCRGEAWCRSSRKPWPGRKCSRGGPRGSRWRQVTTNIREKLWMEGQNNGHLQDQIVLVCDKRLEASQKSHRILYQRDMKLPEYDQWKLALPNPKARLKVGAATGEQHCESHSRAATTRGVQVETGLD